MVTSCCIRNCRNSAKDKYRFFRFPKKRPEKIKIWAEKCGFTYDEIMAHPYWSICEGHFDISQFEKINNAGYLVLKSNAVPTIFTYSPIKTCSQPAPEQLNTSEVNMTVSSCQSSTCEKENDFSVNISKESETFMDEISRYKYLEKRVVDLTRHNKVLCDKNNRLKKNLAANQSKIEKIFNEDQLNFLNRDTTKTSGTWSSETIQKAFQWLFMLNNKGYEYLRKEQHIPLPSLRTLNRHKEHFSFKPRILHKVKKKQYFKEELEDSKKDMMKKKKARRRKIITGTMRRTMFPIRSEISYFLRKLIPLMHRLPSRARAMLKLSIVNTVIDQF